MPPSAITGTSWRAPSSAHSITAESCGTPTPATTRVVQMEPGPMPIFTASAPASISAFTASGVATLPATICTLLDIFLMRVTWLMTLSEWPCAVSTTMRSTPASTSISARRKPASPVPVAAPTRKPFVLVLGGERMVGGLFHVVHGDEPDAR